MITDRKSWKKNDFLETKEGFEPGSIVSFPNGVTELSDSCVEGVKVVRLGNNEIRKEVLAYCADLAEKQEIDFQVIYDFDREFISEEELGFEKV